MKMRENIQQAAELQSSTPGVRVQKQSRQKMSCEIGQRHMRLDYTNNADALDIAAASVKKKTDRITKGRTVISTSYQW